MSSQDLFGEDLAVEKESTVGKFKRPDKEPDQPEKPQALFESDRKEGEMLILPKDKAIACYKLLIDYYSNFHDIESYQRFRKLEMLMKTGSSQSIDGTEWYDDILFNEYDMRPDDMEIRVEELSSRDFYEQIQVVSSMAIVPSPGRTLHLRAVEANTGKTLGFMKLGSPTLNMKPRNVMMDRIVEPEELNRTFYNGIILVPVQPFGYNALGGKLMALIAASTDVRDMFNKKYGTDIQTFETTSLYGSIKQSSQYDGLKPMIRRCKAQTDSNLMMYPSDEVLGKMALIFKSENNGQHAVEANSGSVKLKRMNGMFSRLYASLKVHDMEKHDHLKEFLAVKKEITTKKNYYYCNNINKSVEEMVVWWKRKAQRRYDNLAADDRIRTELEIWDLDTVLGDKIQMIR